MRTREYGAKGFYCHGNEKYFKSLLNINEMFFFLRLMIEMINFLSFLLVVEGGGELQ